jgi:hypothetical protein
MHFEGQAKHCKLIEGSLCVGNTCAVLIEGPLFTAAVKNKWFHFINYKRHEYQLKVFK